MKRASTPKHYFRLPIDASLVSKFLLTYSQNGKIVLEKTEENMTVEDGIWSVQLTQEETNLFKADYANAQVRILTTDGVCLPSQIFRLNVGPVLNDEVMT